MSWQLARRADRDGSLWRVARLDALFGTTVTGLFGTRPRITGHGYRRVLLNAGSCHSGVVVASLFRLADRHLRPAPATPG